MKANTLYNDFIGTSAADISDHMNLNEFLEKQGVDLNCFEAIGATFITGINNSFTASILCIDKEKSTSNEKFITKIGFNKGFNNEDFFNLFKRFEVVITSKTGNYNNIEINEDIIL